MTSVVHSHPGAGASRTASPDRRGDRILVVDDDRSILGSLSEFLRLERYEVAAADSVRAAMGELERATFDLVISDMNLVDGDGFELLRTIKQRWPDLAVVVITAYGTIESAVEAMKLGAFEYLTKPIVDDEIKLVVRRALEHLSVIRENRSLREQLNVRYNLENVVGHTYQMQRVFDLVEAVADSKTTALMHGETGTGKSLVARAIHHRSQRRSKPFVEISCGAMPETLLESELFGHTKGAFTGAMAEKHGKFHAADGGTIFLDEISSASPSLQVKLLRVLQEKQFEPVGSNRTQTVDVRVILATNTDLQKEVTAGRFRQDLYYRVNVVMIELPPLRERLADIPLLAEHFLTKYSQQSAKTIAGFSPEALQCMQRYAWPGNVRELENCVERAVVLTRNQHILKDDLSPQVIADSAPVTAQSVHNGNAKLKDALEEPERRIIEATLEAHGWNRQTTARVLDVNRTTLYKKMKRYGLDRGGK